MLPLTSSGSIDLGVASLALCELGLALQSMAPLMLPRFLIAPAALIEGRRIVGLCCGSTAWARDSRRTKVFDAGHCLGDTADEQICRTELCPKEKESSEGTGIAPAAIGLMLSVLGTRLPQRSADERDTCL